MTTAETEADRDLVRTPILENAYTSEEDDFLFILVRLDVGGVPFGQKIIHSIKYATSVFCPIERLFSFATMMNVAKYNHLNGRMFEERESVAISRYDGYKKYRH